jgi:protein-disulfide isomerase
MPRSKLIALVGAAGALIAAALLAITLVSVGGTKSTTPTAATLPGAAETRSLLAGIPQDGVVLGRPDAPFTLLEYADIQFPYCAAWATEEFPTVVRRHVRAGRLRIVFRGLAFVGPESEDALRAALAAGKQDRLWHVVELLFQNQGPENGGWVSDALVRSAAASTPGLDVERFLDERDRTSVSDQIRAAADEAQRAGVAATPSFALGPTGGWLRPVHVTHLRPAIDEVVAD